MSADDRLATIAEIRAAFPALLREYADHTVAYFDGPGGTQLPRSVMEAVSDYLTHHTANRRWAYPSSAETDRTVERARAAFADLLGCRAVDVVFGANMTSLTYHLGRALGRGWGPGDEIVVTRLDHWANVAPWRALEEERGVSVREVPFHPEDGSLDEKVLAAVITERTRLVAVGWASNALGTVVDVRRAVQLAKDVGALSFVDAVHAVPHLLPSARALACDFLACSPYKFYGPHAGVLFARAELVDELDVPRLGCAPRGAPDRLETGTGNFEAIAGSAAAVDFLASLAAADTRRERLERAYAMLHERGERLLSWMWEGLREIPGVRVYGPPPGRPRTPTVAFTVDGHDARSVAEHLAQRHGVFVSHGDFYAGHVPGDLGVRGGLVRAGCVAYTTGEEVDRLVRGVASLR